LCKSNNKCLWPKAYEKGCKNKDEEEDDDDHHDVPDEKPIDYTLGCKYKKQFGNCGKYGRYCRLNWICKNSKLSAKPCKSNKVRCDNQCQYVAQCKYSNIIDPSRLKCSNKELAQCTKKNTNEVKSYCPKTQICQAWGPRAATFCGGVMKISKKDAIDIGKLKLYKYEDSVCKADYLAGCYKKAKNKYLKGDAKLTKKCGDVKYMKHYSCKWTCIKKKMQLKKKIENNKKVKISI